MLEIAAKLKEFLEDNQVALWYNGLEEKIYLSDNTKNATIIYSGNTETQDHDIPLE